LKKEPKNFFSSGVCMWRRRRLKGIAAALPQQDQQVDYFKPSLAKCNPLAAAIAIKA